jgi:hypothetical protein
VVCVYCVYTNCSSTVDLAVLILNECICLCYWCMAEISSVSACIYSLFFAVKMQVVTACCASKIQSLNKT